MRLQDSAVKCSLRGLMSGRKVRSSMGDAANIATLVAAALSLLTGEVALVVSVYRYGRSSGAKEVTQEAERRAQAQTEAEVEALKREIADLKKRLGAIPQERRRMWRVTSRREV